MSYGKIEPVMPVPAHSQTAATIIKFPTGSVRLSSPTIESVVGETRVRVFALMRLLNSQMGKYFTKRTRK